MANLYVRNWQEFPEVEVLPNNFRRSICGEEAGINYIRVTHPMQVPNHVHNDAEQIMLMQSGKIRLFIAGEEPVVLEAGGIAVLPIGVYHYLESIEGEASFFEVFAPRRVQNLIGYIGRIF